MLTLYGTYILAIAFGAGTAFINDLFFMLSLKHHSLNRHEVVTLKQLNNIQVILIIWIILCEVTFIAVQLQSLSFNYFLGLSIAKLMIELALLFFALLLRQMHLPALIRHQHTYKHLSDSFVEHSNTLIGTAVASLVSWIFIVFMSSSAFLYAAKDFTFTSTILLYLITIVATTWFFIFLKNKILHRKKK